MKWVYKRENGKISESESNCRSIYLILFITSILAVAKNTSNKAFRPQMAPPFINRAFNRTNMLRLISECQYTGLSEYVLAFAIMLLLSDHIYNALSHFFCAACRLLIFLIDRYCFVQFIIAGSFLPTTLGQYWK